MLVSARQVADRLEDVGVTRRQTRQLLAAGFVGRPLVTRAAHLYDSDLVEAVARWPKLAWPAVMSACPQGLFVARRFVDVATPRASQLDVVRGGWPLNLWHAIGLRIRVEGGGRLAFVATVCGHVALGADIQQVAGDRAGRWAFELTDPGAWFGGLAEHRLETGPGRPWTWYPGVAGVGALPP